ncbi:protein of unknown function [Tenacibaculum sp. 190130A14a]|uniref:Lipoprotein n=1 Tax=Tenacibaculum polynesiense TaxID=3137857 RepID=A0ABM9PB74_9FLAO
MKRLFTSVLLIVLCSCNKGFNKSDAELLLKNFLYELKLQNHKEAIKTYPNLKKLDSHITIENFNIENIVEEPNRFKAYVNIGDKGKERMVLFNIIRNKGHLYIESTKGLSPLFDSKIFDFAKKTGCLNINDVNDVLIEEKCNDAKKVFKFNKLVLRKHILDNIKIQNNLTKNSYGGVGGSILLGNKSKYNVPYGAYEITIDLLNENNEIVKTEQIDYLFKDIKSDSKFSQEIFSNGHSEMESSSVNFKFINDTFVDDLIYRMSFKGDECDKFFKELKKRNLID